MLQLLKHLAYYHEINRNLTLQLIHQIYFDKKVSVVILFFSNATPPIDK